MIFYKFHYAVLEENWESNIDSNVGHAYLNEIYAICKTASEQMREQYGRDILCFTYRANETGLYLGMFQAKHCDKEQVIGKYLSLLGMKVSLLGMEEITLRDMMCLVSEAYGNEAIWDEDLIYRTYGLSSFTERHFGPSLSFHEEIISPMCKELVYESAKRNLLTDTMVPELDRIYQGKKMKSGVFGHPVHYVIQMDNPIENARVCGHMIRALYENERLKSRRIVIVEISPEATVTYGSLVQLYRMCQDGSIVFEMNSSNMVMDDCLSGEAEIIESVCKLASRHQSNVLTVFSLSKKGSGPTLDLIREYSNKMVYVPIVEQTAAFDEACEYLKMLAKEKKLRMNKDLKNRLDSEKTYDVMQLREIFEEWYLNRIRTDVYPQYSEILKQERVQKQNFTKGDAYAELMEMIGLSEAKKVIQKILAYGKLQKLNNRNCVMLESEEHLAMHMVFTGNPGTAKTSVARLVARILKDNDIIETSHVVEVGRGDLVGKYVGWTAPNIQKKFIEAMGGVLFIDEAYSLTDDRDGSFGDEAINTIVQEMENHRDNVIVIFAGYPDKMEKFLAKNPGLRSRIAFHVRFDDYSPEELLSIANLIAKKKQLTISKGAEEKLMALMQSAVSEADFGNGRFVRNVLEQARMNQALRLMSSDLFELTQEQMLLLEAEDIQDMAISTTVKPKRTLGFSA